MEILNSAHSQVKLNNISKDSIFEYNLVLDSINIILDHFSFKKEEIKDYNRFRHIPNVYQLFSILDYIYIPAKGVLYVLLDEWGEVKLYEYKIDFSTKTIDKLGKKGKVVLLYKIESMDFKLLQAKSVCIKYINESIMLMLRFPFSSEFKFIKIPLNSFQQATLVSPIETARYETEIQDTLDEIVYISPLDKIIIESIVKKRAKCTPYSENHFQFEFNMENNTSPQRIDMFDKTIYTDDRYFFVKLDDKKMILEYTIRHWIFSEYKEIPIDPTVPINISL